MLRSSLYAGMTTESSIGATVSPAGSGLTAVLHPRGTRGTRRGTQANASGRRAYDTAVTGTDPRSGIGAPAAIAWAQARRGAHWARGRRSLAFIPPWRASVLDDMALNRPLNLLFRVLRARVLLRARSPIRAFGLRGGVTIAIVNWNSLDLLRDVVRALERFGPPAGGQLEILVVDNGSTDGSRAWLRSQRRIGRLRSVLLPRNVFHGPAMDLAFLLASTEYVVALDVDAFPVTDDWLETLLGPLRERKFVSGAQALRGYIHP